jgi:hypothetical protein
VLWCLNREYSVPPFFTHWAYKPAWWAQLRNRAGYRLIDRITRPIRDEIAEYRQKWKLPLDSSYNETPTPNWLSSVNSLLSLNSPGSICLKSFILQDLTITQLVENLSLFRLKS